MKRVLLMGILFVCLLIVLVGCQEKKDKPLTILVFSSVLPTEEARLKADINSVFENGSHVDLQLYPFTMEKWAAELSSRNGDIYVANEETITQMLNKKGLTPLDSVYEGKELPNSTKSYQVTNQESGEVHLYAVPIRKNFYPKNAERTNSKLLAILPEFSGNKENAFRVLKYLADEN
ncbi:MULTISPECIES: hypothetical protein [Bacillaceae]|uniref:hypothetical protein n=1 Tax=Bacillaceae TaxID=186817 RepID=UPI00101D84B2|nr:hypothetical protein [Ectobacillus funiculus]